jgi:hypothetical protein
MLMSGGIGDFLHYLARLPHYISAKDIELSKFIIYVESTAPDRVKRMFHLSFPELHFAFVPARLHWTDTNPLLVPHREEDRIFRPAYQYVRSLGFNDIMDWFLPFLCIDYQVDSAPLLRIVNEARPSPQQYIAISARDKGFLWWPTKEIVDEIESIISGRYEALYLGSAIEKELLGGKVLQAVDVADALTLSYHAQLFIGTDTGFATIREMTGKKNLYCISEYWLNELMYPYKYINESMLKNSGSVFAFNREQLLTNLSRHLDSN